MLVKDATVYRFAELCKERGIAWHDLAIRAGVTPSSVYSMINPARKELRISLIKKLCDGLEISVKAFFDSELFENIEQEIQ